MALSRRDIALFRTALAVALAAITWLATTPRAVPVVEDINDKVTHVLAFLVLGLLADFSFPVCGFGPRKIVALFGFGLLIEAVQHFLPDRDSSLYDLAANAIGLALYGWLAPVIAKLPGLRRRRNALPESLP